MNSGFPNSFVRSKYACKSEINRALLQKMGLPDFVTVEESKHAFDNIRSNCIVVKTGSSIDPRKVRHTKYVLKQALYQEIIKGLYHL